MLTIANLPTQDTYVDALTLGPVPSARMVKYVVANKAVFAKIWPQSKSGTIPPPTDELLITPETNIITDAMGIQFRSAVPGVPAQVVAQLLEPGDPTLGSGTPFSATITSTGGIQPGVSSVQIQHGGALVGTETAIDFDDTALLAWTVTDDPANTRVRASLTIGGNGTIPFTVPAGNYLLTNRLLAGDAQPAFGITGAGQEQWGPGGAGSIDTTWGRVGAGQLGASGYIFVAYGQTFQLRLGNSSGFPTIEFGSALDTRLYRIGAGFLQTDGELRAAGRVRAATSGGVTQVNMGNVGPSGQAGISLGTLGSEDTNLYRYFAGAAATDNQFFANRGGTAQIRLGSNSGQPTIWFGNATGGGDTGDVSIYRPSAATLEIAGQLIVDSQILIGGIADPNGAPHIGLANSGGILATPTGGGVIFVDAGALKYRGSSGSVTTIAPA